MAGFLKSCRRSVFSSQRGERWRSEADLQVGFSSVLISLSLSPPRPPDGPGAESRPPSHPRPPTHRKEEARLLQRLPAEVQLTGEQVLWRRGAKVQKSYIFLQEMDSGSEEG